MEIEKIVSTVQEKVGNTDFSAQTIQKYVELNPVAEGTEPDEAYFTKAVDFLKGMQGQFNHDFSTKFAEAKKNLLTEDTFKNLSAEQLAEVKKLIEGVKVEPPKPEESEEVKALKAQIAALTERLDNGDTAKQKAELLSKVKAAMKEQKANDDYVLDKTLEGADIDVKKSVEDLTKEYLAKYDAEYLKCRGNGAPPRLSSVRSSDTLSDLDKRFEKKRISEGGWGRKENK